MNTTVTRRGVLGGAAALGAIGLGGLSAIGTAVPARAQAALPPRGNFVIRNAYVMTMERDAAT